MKITEEKMRDMRLSFLTQIFSESARDTRTKLLIISLSSVLICFAKVEEFAVLGFRINQEAYPFILGGFALATLGLLYEFWTITKRDMDRFRVQHASNIETYEILNLINERDSKNISAEAKLNRDSVKILKDLMEEAKNEELTEDQIEEKYVQMDDIIKSVDQRSKNLGTIIEATKDSVDELSALKKSQDSEFDVFVRNPVLLSSASIVSIISFAFVSNISS